MKLFLVLIFLKEISGLPNVPLLASWASNATTVAGQPDGTAGWASNSLNVNRGISIADDDTLYIADANNNRVVFLKLDGSLTGTTFRSQSGSDANQFRGPTDVCVRNTSVFVLDTYNYRVQKFPRNGIGATTVPGVGWFSDSYNLFVDQYDNVFVSVFVQCKVVRFTSSSARPVIVAGNGTQGPAPNQLSGPNGLVIDDAGTMYIADTHNHRIQKYTAGATAGTTVAGNGISGNGLQQLYYPESVVADTNGYLYIVDRGNARIVRWGPDETSGTCIVACSDVSGNQNRQLGFPIDLAFDSNGSLYVSDIGTNRVQKFLIVNSTTTLPSTTINDNSIISSSQLPRTAASSISASAEANKSLQTVPPTTSSSSFDLPYSAVIVMSSLWQYFFVRH